MGATRADRTLLGLVQRVEIEPGKIAVQLSPEHVADVFEVSESSLEPSGLTIASSFQHRKRGVETKLVIAGDSRPRDETLFRNIAKAHRYLADIKSGKTFSEIAEAEGMSKRRIQHLIEFAFLAPDIVRRAHEGRQPVGMTSERLLRNEIPSDWQDQRSLFARF